MEEKLHFERLSVCILTGLVRPLSPSSLGRRRIWTSTNYSRKFREGRFRGGRFRRGRFRVVAPFISRQDNQLRLSSPWNPHSSNCRPSGRTSPIELIDQVVKMSGSRILNNFSLAIVEYGRGPESLPLTFVSSLRGAL